MALASQLAPYTAAGIQPYLASSALAAASSCDTGTNGTECTAWWTTTTGPVTLGVGQQMSALNVFNANMVKFVQTAVPDTTNSGGTSQGNPDAGSTTSDQMYTYYPLSFTHSCCLHHRTFDSFAFDCCFRCCCSVIFLFGY